MSTYDTRGGGAKAAFRLHHGLKKTGTNSQMLVQVKFSDDVDVISTETKIDQKFPKIRPHLDSLPKLLSKNPNSGQRHPYSLQWLPDIILSKIPQISPDIINLHWISGGLIRLETIAQLRQPIVWTLHDMWAFTGGCHYTMECDRYLSACYQCPQMPKKYGIDLSHWVWERKQKAWANLNAPVVTPSRWLARCAASSPLTKNWRIEVIPNGINTQVFQPQNKKSVREKLNLPLDKNLILFGAYNATASKRKGFEILTSALKRLSQTSKKEEWELIIFGADKSSSPVDLGLKTHYLGCIDSETAIAQIYAAADVFIAPSLQDNLPNTVMESLACGTPCVAFDIGGMSDMIIHQQNGYLAKPYEVEDLTQGIVWVLENINNQSQKLSDRARKQVEEKFTQEIQARRYSSLFEEITQVCKL
ncbi:MAG: glycosyltransferase family 4 protein [Mastigocoleus sp.]